VEVGPVVPQFPHFLAQPAAWEYIAVLVQELPADSIAQIVQQDLLHAVQGDIAVGEQDVGTAHEARLVVEADIANANCTGPHHRPVFHLAIELVGAPAVT